MKGTLETIVAALDEAGVRYLIVGGVAVVLHGHLRTTADLDIVLSLEPVNTRPALEALAKLGFQPRAPVPMMDFVEAEKRKQWIDEKGMTVFSLWSSDHPLFEIDLFVALPFDFEEVYARSLCVPMDRGSVRVVGLEDLLEMKRQSGRSQDDADIEALEAIMKADDDSR